MSTSTCSLLVGKPQLPDRVGVKLRPATGQQQKSVLFDEIVSRHTLDPDGCPIEGDFDVPVGNARLLTQCFWDYQASSLIYGCSHTIRLPSSWFRSTCARDAAIPDGPTEEQRRKNRYQAAVAVEDQDGAVVHSLLDTVNGHSFTPLAAAEAARRVLSGEHRPGFHTPATLFGNGFAETIADTTIRDL